jgi:predicted ATPase/DNA-binding SARP family transcriptional activator/Tfp pilus assembly protein PilF
MTTLETTSSPLILTLFGPMQALVQGRPLPHLRSRKTLWLLALLTLRHDRPVEREWLAGTLRPDVDQSQAFANLRPILSELRSGLGDQGKRLQTPDRHTVRLDLTGAEVDLLTFDAAIASGKLSALEQAVALYRGSLLEGCTEEWVFQERNVREQNCLQTLQKLGDSALAAGDYARAVGHYQRAVSLDPWWETARRGWMEALAESGDRNAALQVYREFIELLRDDPSASPDEQTSALYARLRAEARQQPRAHAVIVANETSGPVVSGYLPHPLTELVGREDECREVAACLRRSRLVTLTGVGGIGKTRLAIEVAREVVTEAADGVWLVALESLSDSTRVLPQIAAVLGVKEEPGRPLLQSLTERLHTRRLLLVLDNCEHLLEASARVVEHLLRECAEIRILATSREALGITGEMTWGVPVLAVPNPAHLPQGRATLLRVLTGYEGVQLFVERAQAVQKTFSLTGSNAQIVAEVCFRLEGIPLAIELAAARIKAMTVEQIAVRLRNELSLLTAGSRTAQSRQQTLRATLDWSYNLLTEPERLLLRRLSVFAGGWSLEAAEQVCAGESIETWQVLDLLTLLVEKSLLAFEEREAGGRYRLLEMVRQYAAEQLEASGETEQVKVRHRNWFLALGEEAEPQLRGAEQGVWLARLESEHENLRAALAWCRAEQGGAEVELRMAGALWRFWEVHGHYSEGRAYLLEALEREGAGRRTEERARALNGAGVLASYQGDYEAARVLHEESLAISRELGDKQGIAWPLHHLGLMASRQGDYETARARHEESLTIWRELDNKGGIGWSLHQLGSVAREQGVYGVARALYEEALAISRELGDKQGIAWSLNDLGKAAYDQGEYTTAWALHEESLAISRELGDKQGIAWSLQHLGNVAGARDDYASALARHEESLAIFRELEDRQGIAWSLHHLGETAYDQGNYGAARAWHEESLAIQQELGNKLGIAWSLHHLGNVAGARDDYASAQALYVESLSLHGELGDKRGVAGSLEGLAAVMLAQTETLPAVRLWGAAHALRASIGAPLPLKERKRVDLQIEEARATLGDIAFTAAWEEGHTLTWEDPASTLANRI